jgi:PAS domain S-box-containing protein
MRTPVKAYGVALAALLAAVFLRWLLDPWVGASLPLATLFGAVAVASWYGGHRPALLVVIVGYLLFAYLFIEPRGSLDLTEVRNLVGLLMYLITCSILVALGEARQAAQLRFEKLVRHDEPAAPPASGSSSAARRRTPTADLIGYGFALTVAVLVGGGALGYRSARVLADHGRQVIHTYEVIGELEAVLSTLKDAETGQRGYLLTEDPRYLEPYDDAVRRLRSELGRLYLLISNPEQQARLAALDMRVARRLEELQRSVGLMKQGDRPGALEVVGQGTGKALMDAVRTDLAALEQAYTRLLQEQAARSATSYRTAVLFILVPAIIGVWLVAMVYYLFRRQQRAAAQLAEQRERLRVTLASIGDAVITTDTDARITFMNPIAESLLGWIRDEAIGEPLDSVFRIVEKTTRAPIPSPTTRVLREGAVVGLANHTILIRKDGTERPIDDSAAPITDGHGRTVGCVLVFRDATVRRAAEAELRRSEEHIRSVVNTIVDGIITIEQDGTVETFNPAAERIFGIAASEVIGQNVRMLMPEPYHHEHDGYLANYLHTGQAKIIGIGREVLGRRNDGSTFPMDLAVSEFRVGEERRFTGIVRDITVRKQAEAALREVDRRKNEFLAMLAHELRNPLAPIRNAVQVLLLKGSHDPDLKWSRDVISRQVAHMARLLDDLLDVSRISHRKLELRKERIELAEVIGNAVETSRPLIDSGGHDLAVVLPSAPVYLQADSVRLAQVFANLLNNAAKYTQPGGHIRLTAERQGSDVVVTVQDDGMGIAADMLPRIFDMFSQGDRVVERYQGGLGIGLSLSRGLVELHGGSIEARSDGPDQGSEFIIRLSAIVGPEATPAPPEEAPPAAAPQYQILIADDLKDSTDSLALLFKVLGHEVHTAYDGEAALREAARLKPEVLLLDIGMPKLNGYEVCRRIRQQAWGREILIIALTGWGQEDDRRRTEEAGFDHHIVKPVDPAVMMKLLTTLKHPV